MLSPRRKLVLCVTGMPGAGKTLASQYASHPNYPIVSMGDVIRRLAEGRGLSPTREVLTRLMVEVRRKGGPAAVAAECAKLIEGCDEPFVIVDGVRSVEEVEELRKRFDVVTLSILCPAELRFQRLKARGRPDDPRVWEEFQERERAELALGLDEVIRSADFSISNEGTREELRRQVRRIVEGILHERGIG